MADSTDFSSEENNSPIGVFAFIVLAVLVIIVSGAIMSSTLDRNASLLEMMSHAEKVQMKVHQNYGLTGITSADDMDLSREFPASYPNELHLLMEASKKHGHVINTGYKPGSLGHALSQSNYILTGEVRPRLLDIKNIQARIDERYLELVEDK